MVVRITKRRCKKKTKKPEILFPHGFSKGSSKLESSSTCRKKAEGFTLSQMPTVH
jgi:hypothetical protein